MRRTALLDVRDRYAVRCAGRARPGGQRRGQASRTRSMTPRKIADMVEGNLVHQEHRVEGIATQDALAATPIPGLAQFGSHPHESRAATRTAVVSVAPDNGLVGSHCQTRTSRAGMCCSSTLA